MHTIVGVLSKYQLPCSSRSPPSIAPVGCGRVLCSAQCLQRAPMGRSHAEEQLPASHGYFTLIYSADWNCFDTDVILFSFSHMLLLLGVICQHEVFLINMIKLFY